MDGKVINGIETLYASIDFPATRSLAYIYGDTGKRIAEKIDINDVSTFGESILHKAVRLKDVPVIFALLEWGASPYTKDTRGKMAIPNINDVSTFGETLYHKAVRAKNIDVMTILCYYGAKPLIPNKRGLVAVWTV